MVDPSRHADRRGWMETVLRYLPGFKGYLEKEYRRESDQLLRKWMVDELHKAKIAVDEGMQGLLARGDLDALPACERLHSRIDELQNQLRGAVAGYSGWFDFVQVDEARLDSVYGHDAALLKSVESFVGETKSFASAPDTSGATELLAKVGSLIENFGERGRILDGIGS
ncbi:MAG TPA: hypothetical protein VGN57_05020 [Pirellulaceae bacterium]|jgi:hypothetical protein|nr:hypothetical protein [Pirellulaceae bacterium]